MALHLTAVFRKVPEGYVGFVEELPGANSLEQIEAAWKHQARRPTVAEVDAWVAVGRREFPGRAIADQTVGIRI